MIKKNSIILAVRIWRKLSPHIAAAINTELVITPEKDDPDEAARNHFWHREPVKILDCRILRPNRKLP
jgi:hypothetical protein